MDQNQYPQGPAQYPQQQYPGYQQQPGQYSQQSPDQQGYSDANVERIEEVAEAIIDEKWNELVRNINKIIDWKDKTESRIAALEQGLKDLKSEFDSLHRGILGKIGEYDQNIVNIGTEIKAMERVFQKVLPVFTENVNELNRVTEEIRAALSQRSRSSGDEASSESRKDFLTENKESY